MADILHGDNCECCKDLSPIAKSTLAQLQGIISGVEGFSGSPVKTAKEEILGQLLIENQNLAEIGGLSDVYRLAERFFEVDFNSIVVSDYPMNPEDADAVVGKNSKLKAKDITDNPTINVAKIVNFDGLNFKNFDKVKVSVTTPTINVTKTIKVGPLNTKMDVSVSFSGIEWGLTPSEDYNTPAKAIAELKKYTTKEPLRPSAGVSEETIKNLANEQLINSPDVLQQINAAQTPEEIFSILDENKVSLDVEVNIGEQMEALYNEKTESENNIKNAESITSGDKVIETLDDLSKIDLCAPRPAKPPKFDKEEVKDIVPCKVKNDEEQAEPPVTQKEIDDALKEINDLLSNVPTEESQQTALDDCTAFVNSLDDPKNQMGKCAAEKADLTNDWYLYYEEWTYHKITNRYFNKLYEQSKNVRLDVIRILKKRDVAVNQLVEIDRQLEQVASEIYNYQKDTFGEAVASVYTTVFKTKGIATATPFEDLSKDPTAGAQILDQLRGETIDPSEIPRSRERIARLILNDPKFLATSQNRTAIIKIITTYFDRIFGSGWANETAFAKNIVSTYIGNYSPLLRKVIFDTSFYEVVISELDEYTNRISALLNSRNAIFTNLEAIQAEYNTFRNDTLGGATDVNTAVKNIRDLVNAEIRKLTFKLGYFKNEIPTVFNIPVPPLTSIFQLYHPSKLKLEEKKRIVEDREETYFETPEDLGFHNKINELWGKAVNHKSKKFSTGVDVQGVNSPLNDYVKKLEGVPSSTDPNTIVLNIPDDPTYGKGAFNDHVWGPFYSKDRIENYFTYYEQGFNKEKPKPVPGGDPNETFVEKPLSNVITGETQTIKVPASFNGLDINLKQATGHLENFELFLKKRVIFRTAEIENSDKYKNALAQIENLAVREAKILFFLRNPVTLNFLGNPINSYNQFDDIARNAAVVNDYLKRLRSELRAIEVKIRKAQECVDANQKKIEELAIAFAEKTGNLENGAVPVGPLGPGSPLGPIGITGGTGGGGRTGAGGLGAGGELPDIIDIGGPVLVLGKNGVGFDGTDLNTIGGPASIDKSPSEIIANGNGVMIVAITTVLTGSQDNEQEDEAGTGGGAGANAGANARVGSKNIKKKCKDLLGSDPVGIRPPSGECPNYTKNCWWAEFTKLLQLVSLMPIPELDMGPMGLSSRLFRYYPVPLIIPIPPFVAPSLTLPPIVQPLIAIPLPFLWKHIISIKTPLGVFVIWIALAGGFMPNVYIMLIDEQMQSSFIVTLKGPTSIPAKPPNLMLQTPIEKMSLLQMLPGLDTLMRVNLKTPLGKKVVGTSRLDASNPDAPSTAIDNIKNKIKKSIDEISISDPPFAGNSAAALDLKSKIKRAFDVNNPDISGFETALTQILNLASSSIDKIDVAPIKIPKNAKGLMLEPPEAIAMIETAFTLINSAINAPADQAKKILSEVGVVPKTFNVKEKLNTLVRSEIDTPDIQNLFATIDTQINTLEASLPATPQTPAEVNRAITERARKIKQIVAAPLEKLASKITPEMLGFVSIPAFSLPLPFPCYSNLSLSPIPPYIPLAKIAIKQVPNLIKAIPDAAIAGLLSKAIDLNLPLPDAKTIFQTALNGLLTVVPPLILPITGDQTILKQVANSLKNFLLSFKLRLPKPGLPIQLTIPPSIIKGAIKTAIATFLNGIKNIIMGEVRKISSTPLSGRAAKVLAIIGAIKLLFGVELEKMTGNDIKAFIASTIEKVAYPPLDVVKNVLRAASAASASYQLFNVIRLFTIPGPAEIADTALSILKEGPLVEVNTKLIQQFVDPLLKQVVPVVFNSLPFPVTLLGCSFTPTRILLTKIHPVKPIDKLPSWEGLTLKNMPLVIFLDQIAATAQRGALLWSWYYPPGFLPLIP